MCVAGGGAYCSDSRTLITKCDTDKGSCGYVFYFLSAGPRFRSFGLPRQSGRLGGRTQAGAPDDIARSEIRNPQRAARLVEQEVRNSNLPGLDEVLDRLVGTTFGTSTRNGYEAEVSRTVQRVVQSGLLGDAAVFRYWW